jgi:hypothetical protein
MVISQNLMMASSSLLSILAHKLKNNCRKVNAVAMIKSTVFNSFLKSHPFRLLSPTSDSQIKAKTYS